MMPLFDTHCHLFMEPLGNTVQAVLQRAANAGVSRFLVPAVSKESWKDCIRMADFPGTACALGVHPWWAGEGVNIQDLENAITASGAVAVGEIGLDWKCRTDRKVQYRVFKEQLELAEKMSLPVSLHCRGAFEEMLHLLKQYRVNGAVHAWSASPELMDRFIQTGFFVSFGGAVTRKGAIRAIRSARDVPEDRFILETDAPSIGLEGVEPGESEPAHLANILSSFALIRGESPETVSRQAWLNSISLFGE